MTSTIQRRASARSNLLVFEIAGKIAKPDIESMAEQVDEAFDASETIDLLVIFTEFEGAEAGAVFDREAMGVQLRSVRHVRKYAVVGAPAWARAMIEVSDFLSPVEAKTFDLADEAEARTWIDA